MGQRRFFFPGERRLITMPSSIAPPTRKKRRKDLPFGPIKKAVVHKELLVYDFESKDDDSQRPGFTRPFMCGLLDHGNVYRAFFDNNSSRDDGDFRKRVVSPKGCVDEFCNHVFRMTAGTFEPEYVGEHAEFYAHNGGRFDATFLLVWLYLQRDTFHVEMTCVQGRIQSLSVTPRGEKPGDKTTISFLDSSMIFPQMKLGAVTNLFSVGEKKLTDFDLKTPEWERDKWIEYNRPDCIGLRDALHGYRDLLEAEGGELAMTAPSSSMRLFRRRFLKEKFDRAKHFPFCTGVCLGCNRGGECDGTCHGCLHDWIRSGYFGGRVEIFERFAPPPMYYYDLNSSYPASMMKPMPVGRPLAILSNEGFVRERDARRAAGQLAFVEATVSVPTSCDLPPLPHIVNNKLCFPAGEFHGVFELDELSLLHDPFVNGRIVHVDRSVWFEGKVIFKDFVETLYAYKQRGSEMKERLRKEKRAPTQEEQRIVALGELAKLMVNSEYGKHAMKPERETLIYVPEDAASWPDDAKPLDGHHETCRVWIKPKYVDPCYIIPQWSARITALSRIAWWTQARDVILAGGKVYAGDTDALQISIKLPEEVCHQTRLGAWKREHDKEVFGGCDVSDEELKEFFGNDPVMFDAWKAKYGDVAPAAAFLSPKFYALLAQSGNHVVHMKGVPKDFHTIETFRLLASGGELRKEKHRTSQPKTVLRGLQKGGPLGITMLDSVKTLRSVYDKRIVNNDGTTSPLVLHD